LMAICSSLPLTSTAPEPSCCRCCTIFRLLLALTARCSGSGWFGGRACVCASQEWAGRGCTYCGCSGPPRHSTACTIAELPAIDVVPRVAPPSPPSPA
jgi:hypothetical protein